MTEPTTPERALQQVAQSLAQRGRSFALVGGLAVSVRAEVRFTRDVDLAVAVRDDQDAEELIYMLRSESYHVVATVEHESQNRLATARLVSPLGVKVDLLFASSGIEAEIAERATSTDVGRAGSIRVARAEELLAMKILSMNEDRLQDEIDARRLVEFTPDLDLGQVRSNLDLVTERGYNRGQDLRAKLAALLQRAKA